MMLLNNQKWALQSNIKKMAADKATNFLFASHQVTYFSVWGSLLIWVVDMT